MRRCRSTARRPSVASQPDIVSVQARRNEFGLRSRRSSRFEDECDVRRLAPERKRSRYRFSRGSGNNRLDREKGRAPSGPFAPSRRPAVVSKPYRWVREARQRWPKYRGILQALPRPQSRLWPVFLCGDGR